MHERENHSRRVIHDALVEHAFNSESKLLNLRGEGELSMMRKWKIYASINRAFLSCNHAHNPTPHPTFDLFIYHFAPCLASKSGKATAPEAVMRLFAFAHFKDLPAIPSQDDGWGVYSIAKEFERQVGTSECK